MLKDLTHALDNRCDSLNFVAVGLLGFIGHVGGGLIHILLVIAISVVLIQAIQGRREW